MSEDKDYLLSVVVPVYCEEKGIDPFLERMKTVLNQIGCRYEILFCLDPSPDSTYDVIKKHTEQNKTSVCWNSAGVSASRQQPWQES